MEMPRFPCFKVDIANTDEAFIKNFISCRPDQNWLLLAEHAALSQHQLWTAWLLAQRAFRQDRALARSIDAEFLRYMAGTHHVTEAFKKVGINVSHRYAWIVHLPKAEFSEGEIIPDFDSDEVIQMFDNLVKSLNIRALSGSPEMSAFGLENLGISVDNISEETEDRLIGFMISTELNS